MMVAEDIRPLPLAGSWILAVAVHGLALVIVAGLARPAPPAPAEVRVVTEPAREDQLVFTETPPLFDDAVVEEPPPEARIAGPVSQHFETQTVAPRVAAAPGGGADLRRGRVGSGLPAAAAPELPQRRASQLLPPVGEPSVSEVPGEDGGGDTSDEAAGPLVGRGLDLTAFADPSALASLTPPSLTPDMVDVPEGDVTMIDTAASRYWSYFERMRTAISLRWHPGVALQRFPDALSDADRVTVVRFELDRAGNVVVGFIERPSGVSVLDDEAVFAIRAAAPFRNVPEGLLDEDGRARIRFEFRVTLAGPVRVRRLN